jgi:serine/threonine protein kinase
VLDFGIATASWAGGFDLSSLNAYTVAYASPEALQGEPRDPRDDIYSLSCLIYITVTGSHPFGRASALDARKSGARAARPANAPGPAWSTLQKGLAFERGKRPKDAAAFHAEYSRRGLLDRWRKQP